MTCSSLQIRLILSLSKDEVPGSVRMVRQAHHEDVYCASPHAEIAEA
jgi:hypothetical protein